MLQAIKPRGQFNAADYDQWDIFVQAKGKITFLSGTQQSVEQGKAPGLASLQLSSGVTLSTPIYTIDDEVRMPY